MYMYIYTCMYISLSHSVCFSSCVFKHSLKIYMCPSVALSFAKCIVFAIGFVYLFYYRYFYFICLYI